MQCFLFLYLGGLKRKEGGKVMISIYCSFKKEFRVVKGRHNKDPYNKKKKNSGWSICLKIKKTLDSYHSWG